MCVVLGLLKKSVAGRIVFTSSLLAFTNNLSLKNLNFDCEKPNSLDIQFVYGNSKLSMIMAADTFAEKLKGTGVAVNSIHPGLVKTPIFTKTYAVYKNVFYEMFIWLSQCVIGKVSNCQMCRGVSECFVGPLGRISRIGSRCSFPTTEKRNRNIFWGMRPYAETLESL
jgi:NAD(P)-dependent dehydrogenase (short-subunit alcohol dehydrogenase family)